MMHIRAAFLLLFFIAPLARAEPIAPMHTLNKLKQPVTGLAFAPDNQTIAISFADSTLRIFSVSKKTELAKFDVTGGPNCLKYSPDGKYLMAITNNGVLSVDVANKKVKHVFGFDAPGGVTAIDISPDGKQLAAVGKSALATWNIETGVNLATIDAHSGNMVLDVAFSPEGDLIATAGSDKKIITWNATTAQQQKEFDLTSKGVSIEFLPGGNHLIVACDNQTIRKVNATSGDDEQLAVVGGAVKSLAVSPDRPIAVVGGAGPVGVLIEKKKLATRKIAGHQAPVAAVAMSPDGRFFASGDQTGVVNIYGTMDVE